MKYFIKCLVLYKAFFLICIIFTQFVEAIKHFYTIKNLPSDPKKLNISLIVFLSVMVQLFLFNKLGKQLAFLKRPFIVYRMF